MASYHFRVKTDKKSDGSRISASVHVDYIKREGKYEDEGAGTDEKNFLMNVITSDKVTDIFNGQFALLYVTDEFGSIANTYKGIGINGNFSDVTILIALELAKEGMNNTPLKVKGSKKFRNKVLKMAAKSELNISFADEEMQQNFLKAKERVRNEREQFVGNGGTILPTSTFSKSNTANTSKRTLEASAEAGLCVSTLSKRIMAHAEQANSGLSLLDDEHNQLVNTRKEFYSALRRNVDAEQRQLAEDS